MNTFNVMHISTAWYWNRSCVIQYSSDSTLRTSIFTQLPITSDCCEGYRSETSVAFILRGTKFVLVLLDIYPIVPYVSAFCRALDVLQSTYPFHLGLPMTAKAITFVKLKNDQVSAEEGSPFV